MSTGAAIALSQLIDISGEANVIGDPASVAAYQIDGQIPAAAVRPSSEEEVAEIVKFAAREKLAVVVSAARTKLAMGMPPRQYDLAVDMTRMNRIVAYDPQDLTLAVEPGTSLRALANTLADHGQFLPLAVPFAVRSTVGGTIASGVDSPLRQTYGTARDFVLGMQFVTGDGIAAKSGGRVVKNVSGYDIHKILIGSLGTLAVITRINFRTFPLPRTTSTFAAIFRTIGSACEFRNALAQSALRPRTLEILGVGRTSPPELKAQLGIPLGANEWAVLVSFAGEETVLKRVRGEMGTLAAGRSDLDSVTELDPGAEGKVLDLISEFPAAIQQRFPSAAIFRISTLPTELPDLGKRIESIEMPWALMMRGVGVAYLALLTPSEGESALLALQHECARILSLGGNPPWRSATLPWCPAALKHEIDVWGALPASLDLMRKLKAVFDPAGILSPGRFVGGI
jgi:glycolate oxidase FAD binding subunit